MFGRLGVGLGFGLGFRVNYFRDAFMVLLRAQHYSMLTVRHGNHIQQIIEPLTHIVPHVRVGPDHQHVLDDRQVAALSRPDEGRPPSVIL